MQNYILETAIQGQETHLAVGHGRFELPAQDDDDAKTKAREKIRQLNAGKIQSLDEYHRFSCLSRVVTRKL